ncbi:MAG: hypothetical protein IJW80_05265, partial [Alistipes sp.]|nr:hypothetical protein [Alistipes sp.]
MKRFFTTWCLLIGLLTGTGCINHSTTSDNTLDYPLNVNDMRVRDPFILANAADSTYYMHANSGKGSFVCYAS